MIRLRLQTVMEQFARQCRKQSMGSRLVLYRRLLAVEEEEEGSAVSHQLSCDHHQQSCDHHHIGLLQQQRPHYATYSHYHRMCQLCYHTSAAAHRNDIPPDLHELICQGKYNAALDLWEAEKDRGVSNPTTYQHIMLLCEKLGSAEAARAVSEDMARQGLEMDKRCMLHYVYSLLSEKMAEEAVELIKTSTYKEDADFLNKAVSSFSEHGYLHAALSLCHLLEEKKQSPSLLATELEILGAMKNQPEMRELVNKVYGANLASAPREVRLALANGLSLAGEHGMAMEVLREERTPERREEGETDGGVERGSAVPMRSLVLLLESAKQAQDYCIGVKVFNWFWNKSSVFHFKLEDKETHSAYHVHQKYLLRAVDTFIHLQALALRDIGGSKGEPQLSPNLEAFTQHNFLKQLRSDPFFLQPTPEMVTSLLLLACFNGQTRTAEDAFIVCRKGGVLRPHHLTGWTKCCGPLQPQQALPLIKWVKHHSLDRDRICLRLCEYNDLLGLQYKLGRGRENFEEASTCIRTIKNMMQSRRILVSPEAYHSVMRAFIEIKDIAGLIGCYKEMGVANLEPVLETYHILVDGFLEEGSVRCTSDAVYGTWRKLVKEFPRVQPDVALMNKFIQCCRMCKSYDRAFFFLSCFNSYNLVPDLNTFRELLKICNKARDRERLQLVARLALTCIPKHEDTVNSIVASIEEEWREKEKDKEEEEEEEVRKDEREGAIHSERTSLESSLTLE